MEKKVIKQGLNIKCNPRYKVTDEENLEKISGLIDLYDGEDMLLVVSSCLNFIGNIFENTMDTFDNELMNSLFDQFAANVNRMHIDFKANELKGETVH